MAYSSAQEAQVRAAAPLNLAKAKALADKLGVSYRSVIAKAKQLGVEYVKAEPVAKAAKDAGPTKAQILSDIRLKLGLADRDGDLTKTELMVILASL